MAKHTFPKNVYNIISQCAAQLLSTSYQLFPVMGQASHTIHDDLPSRKEATSKLRKNREDDAKQRGTLPFHCCKCCRRGRRTDHRAKKSKKGGESSEVGSLSRDESNRRMDARNAVGLKRFVGSWDDHFSLMIFVKGHARTKDGTCVCIW